MSLDSHQLAQALCRPRSRVLDVGCGDGSVAERLRDLGCEVVGLDISPEAVTAMGELGMEAHQIDLDVDKLDDVLGDGEEFDVIVCLDVLEHTRKPAEVLGALLERLVADGDVVISLPNVTHADVRLSLLAGEFRYRDEGLLDATHLRFFDRSGVEELLAGCGLEMREFHPVRFPLGGTELGVDVDQVPEDLRDQILQDEDAEIYQWVFRAQRIGSLTPPSTLQELAQQAGALAAAEAYANRVVGELDAAQAAMEEAKGYVAALEKQLGDVEADRDTAYEMVDLLRREVQAQSDVVDLMSEEVSALELHLEQARQELAAVRVHLHAIETRRSYRLVRFFADRAARLPLARSLVRRAR